MIFFNISSIATYDFFINSTRPTMSYVGPHALHEVIWPMPCIWPHIRPFTAFIRAPTSVGVMK